MRLKGLFAATALVGCIGAGSANAAFINGLVSLSDGFAQANIGTTTSIVSGLTTVIPGNNGVPNGCTNNFATAGACTYNTFSTGTIHLNAAPDSGIFTYGIFSFSSLTYTQHSPGNPLACSAGQCTDALVFDITGIVDDGAGGFDPTAFSGTFSANGSCQQALAGGNLCDGSSSASWSISLVALGRNTTPEPASLALVGLGLAGLGFFRRRKNV